MRKHSVIFMSPGTFFNEESSRDIDSWDITKAVEMSKDITERYGAKPYGFQFGTYIVVDPVPDGECGTLEVIPKQVEKSGIYYLGGILRTIEEVESAANPKEKILLDNMRCNQRPLIIQNDNSWRYTAFFDIDDFIVNDLGGIVERGNDPIHVNYRKTTIERLDREMKENR